MPIGNSLNVIKVEKPKPLNIVNHIAGNATSTFFIKNNGKLYAAGTEKFYHFGIKSATNSNTVLENIQFLTKNVTCVSVTNDAGDVTTSYVKNGNHYAAGSNRFGTFFKKDPSTWSNVFLQITTDNSVTNIKSGQDFVVSHSTALTFSGLIHGKDKDGNSQLPTINYISDTVTLFSAGPSICVFLEKGILKSIGYGVLGDGNDASLSVSKAITMEVSNLGGRKIKNIFTDAYTIVLCDDNTTYITRGNFRTLTNFSFTGIPTNVNIKQISLKGASISILLEDGTVYKSTAYNVTFTKINIAKNVLEILNMGTHIIYYCDDDTFYGSGKYSYALGTIAGYNIGDTISDPVQLTL